MKYKAFGAIDLLIGLLITSVIFIIGINTFKGISSIKINNSANTKSIEQEVDKTVNEIETMRKQSIEYNNKELQNNNY